MRFWRLWFALTASLSPSCKGTWARGDRACPCDYEPPCQQRGHFWGGHSTSLPCGAGRAAGRWLPGLKMATVPASRPSGRSASPRGGEPAGAARAASLNAQGWGRGCSGLAGAGRPPSSSRGQSARGASSPGAARARGVWGRALGRWVPELGSSCCGTCCCWGWRWASGIGHGSLCYRTGRWHDVLQVTRARSLQLRPGWAWAYWSRENYRPFPWMVWSYPFPPVPLTLDVLTLYQGISGFLRSFCLWHKALPYLSPLAWGDPCSDFRVCGLFVCF